MQIFLDTADVKSIERYMNLGVVDGVTTNPSLIAKSGKKYIDVLKQVSNIVPGPVSAEVVSESYEYMLEEAHKLYSINNNIVVKLPLIADGLKVAVELKKDNIPINFTLCFSPAQALLVAKIGAEYVSPFLGRIDDISFSGIGLVNDIVNIYSNYKNFNTKIIVASVRNLNHILESASLGADVVTIPPKLLDIMLAHPLTEQGLDIFRAANQTI